MLAETLLAIVVALNPPIDPLTQCDDGSFPGWQKVEHLTWDQHSGERTTAICLFMSTDLGQTWTEIACTMPDEVYFDPDMHLVLAEPIEVVFTARAVYRDATTNIESEDSNYICASLHPGVFWNQIDQIFDLRRERN